ncbi:(R)-mandelonitrile lyase 1-like [Ziziphus jujuba]|uniref:(R)-mandelonitrile lyase n=1 Tax=Ziziphus jujuba TaxID=326968 RepID=A0ABM3ZYR0_ZIZJJ|nr:(R)-mandelonitrile lyase 1-like [Ziziphus jujuba]
MAPLALLLLFSFFHPQVLVVLALPTSSANDFSYMKSVHNATDLPAEEKYDYIIVGGGTAGCSLASTLSSNYSVLVLERGSVPAAHPEVLKAEGFVTTLRQTDDGDTPAQRFTSEDGVANARGRILGGTSMINAGLYTRADEVFYLKSGIPWDRSLVRNAYNWVEDAIVFQTNLSTWQSIIKQALLEAGVVPDNGFSLDHKIGTKASGSTFDDEGRRHGAVELLNRGELKNLRIAVHATVERIIISSNIASRLGATGVIYTDSKGLHHRAMLRDKGEVILSAGAIGSPQLLLLSGVGPVSHLSSLQIPVVLPNPYVGKFMADNPTNRVSIIAPFPLDQSNLQVVGITSDFYIENLSYKVPSSSTNISVAGVGEKIPGPISSGSLWLKSSSNATISPNVRFNYFDNPIDLARCVKGVRKIGDLLNTKTMEQFKTNNGEGFVFLGTPYPKNPEDDKCVEAFCRSTLETIWHYHGGCLVGKVVDGDLRVIGIDALRVVDGSIFNRSPGTNPQATVMMLGRYVGLKMVRERNGAK